MAEQAYLVHLISRLTADVQFLSAQGALSPEDSASIQSKLSSASLPSSHGPNALIKLEQQTSSLSLSNVGPPGGGRVVPPPPAPKPASLEPQPAPVKRVRAVWDYAMSQPDDLAFKVGDVVTIVNEENADWWRGELGECLLFVVAARVARC